MLTTDSRANKNAGIGQINQSNQAMVRGIRIRAAGISAERKGNIHYDDIGITENGE